MLKWSVVAVFALLLVFVAAERHETYYERSFKEFVKRYNKTYSGYEIADKFKAFKDNLMMIEKVSRLLRFPLSLLLLPFIYISFFLVSAQL